MMTGTIFEEIKKAMEMEDGMSQDVRDRLMLSGIISLYGEINGLKGKVDELSKILPLYKLLVVIGTTLIALIVGFLWSVFTGQVELIF